MLATTPALATPQEVASVIHASQPYGSGKYTVLFITAYDAEVWTDAPQWSMNAPFALTLRYHIGFSSDYLVNRTLREMKGVNPALTDADIARYRKAMAFFAPASSGDEMTMLYQPGQPTRFFKNGAPTGEISEPGFAADFFGVWLSPNTSDPDLRKSLLKLN
ncbi:MAG TPA: chalcone isomerase family protein [Rhizomicrobium sp.]|nr:chalcone isomerase family protein [Rhizomicrobium sp.]